MNTIIVKVKNEDTESRNIDKAGQIIRNGGLVAFPTETVYGLGADALNAEAAAKIYAAKGRPSDNPLIAHIADIEMLKPLVKDIPGKAEVLMEKFWPGPMTLVFNKSDIVPDGTTGGLVTVAVRMPNNDIARALIQAAGTSIAAPSANLSGKPSPTMAEHVIEDMDGRIDMIIDGGMVGMGLESTIIDVTCDPPMILRPGFITKEMLQSLIGEVAVDKTIYEKPTEATKPKAPGMKYRHYAPSGEFTMYKGEIGKVAQEIIKQALDKESEGYKVGIITSDQHLELYSILMKKENIQVVSIGSESKPETIANNLYKVLREFDNNKAEYIWGETFAENDLGQAIMNRLTKAAGYNIIRL